ncbi:MAG: hypothetical protein N3B16_12595 [Candidatus Aminicenantes bacterium]|nr:hypothetical protein [Candidatus Aminicenantes bacterium]
MSQSSIEAIQARITDEIFFALGFNRSGFLRHLFGWLFYWPTYRFARLFAKADEVVKEGGLPAGSLFLIQEFSINLLVHGAEAIPDKGPLLLIANHPGAHDAMAIAAKSPRPDLKILVSETGFYYTLTNAKEHLIFVANEAERRMLSLRQAIRWLERGGAILQFATGTLDGDPALEENKEEWLQNWSSSLELMLRQVPETKIVLTAVSHVLLRRFFYHPLVRLYRKPVMRRRLAEFLQVIHQLIWPKSVKVGARVSFAQPLQASELQATAQESRLLTILIDRARHHFRKHLAFNWEEEGH